MTNLIKSAKKIINDRKRLAQQNEATTTSAIAGYATPYAFSKKGKKGNVNAAQMLGYTLTDASCDNTLDSDGGDMNEVEDGDDIVKSNECETDIIDSKDVKKNTLLQRRKLKEGVKSSIYKFKNEQTSDEDQNTTEFSVSDENTDVENSINVQDVFVNFQQKLNDSSEDLKYALQRSLIKKVLGKKITARSSKGQGQPISDYTFSVTGVDIDYYNNKYFIVLIGKEEGKGKSTRFLLQPFYKIKSYGPSKSLKPSDIERIAQYKSLLKSDEVADIEQSSRQPVKKPDRQMPSAPKQQPVKFDKQQSSDRPSTQPQISSPR